jgi:hypothetical protein
MHRTGTTGGVGYVDAKYLARSRLPASAISGGRKLEVCGDLPAADQRYRYKTTAPSVSKSKHPIAMATIKLLPLRRNVLLVVIEHVGFN